MPYESTKIHNSIWRKRLEIRILSLNPQIIEELVRPVVHNQLVREICLFQQRIEPFVVGYLERDMCIAAKNRRHLVLLTPRTSYTNARSPDYYLVPLSSCAVEPVNDCSPPIAYAPPSQPTLIARSPVLQSHRQDD